MIKFYAQYYGSFIRLNGEQQAKELLICKRDSKAFDLHLLGKSLKNKPKNIIKLDKGDQVTYGTCNQDCYLINADTISSSDAADMLRYDFIKEDLA